MTHALPALKPAISPVWHMLQMWRVLHLSIPAASWAVYVRIISCSVFFLRGLFNLAVSECWYLNTPTVPTVYQSPLHPVHIAASSLRFYVLSFFISLFGWFGKRLQVCYFRRAVNICAPVFAVRYAVKITSGAIGDNDFIFIFPA